jgi:hypothetical protein
MPTPVSTGSVAFASSGGFHSCAVVNRLAFDGEENKTVGIAQCWGENSSGQLGDGTETNRNTPVDVLM